VYSNVTVGLEYHRTASSTFSACHIFVTIVLDEMGSANFGIKKQKTVTKSRGACEHGSMYCELRVVVSCIPKYACAIQSLWGSTSWLQEGTRGQR
jgi:hypothetical protein